MSLEPGRVDLLELDVDVRLGDLWRDAQDFDIDLDALAAFMRCAYARGYTDALSERDRGLLLRDHGYRVPDRRATA